MSTQVLLQEEISLLLDNFLAGQGRTLSSGLTVVGFEVLTTVTTSSSIFLDIMLYSLVKVN
jgi:hypothetical protein